MSIQCEMNRILCSWQICDIKAYYSVKPDGVTLDREKWMVCGSHLSLACDNIFDHFKVAVIVQKLPSKKENKEK